MRAAVGVVVGWGVLWLAASTVTRAYAAEPSRPPESPAVVEGGSSPPGGTELPGVARHDHAAPALAGPLRRALVVELALSRNLGVRAAYQRARRSHAQADAEGRLPPPEVEMQMLQVPIDRPWAVIDAQMLMVGVRQTFPAPGLLAARSRAVDEEANLIEIEAASRSRSVARDAEHAWTDYLAAFLQLQAHQRHHRAVSQVLAAANARYATGGALSDVSQTEVELARVDADLATEQAQLEVARARINGFLLRDPDAVLGPPLADDPVTVADDVRSLTARARAQRPEARAARRQKRAARAALEAADAEAAWPMFTVGAYYFAPTTTMPEHGYGVSLSATLPWAWGGASSRRRVEQVAVDAARLDAQEAEVVVTVEVSAATAQVKALARRFQRLRDRVVPATARAIDAAQAGYASGGVDVLAWLTASTSAIEVELDLIEARAALDHALIELDWAAGSPVKRRPIEVEP